MLSIILCRNTITASRLKTRPKVRDFSLFANC
jgi:hypothetical protein